MKKVLYSLIILLLVCSTGCGKEKTNENSELALAKKNMSENLDNYSFDVKITAKTGFMDTTTNMKCKADVKNGTNYCSSSTYGVTTEEYIDYNNNVSYTRTTIPFSGEVGKWESSKYESDTNTWIGLNDYIFDIKEESKDGGTYYTGTIDSKKLASAISQSGSDIDSSGVVSDDIEISVFVNSSNYIEKMSFSLEILGIEEHVEIICSNFNTTGDVVIPSSVK